MPLRTSKEPFWNNPHLYCTKCATKIEPNLRDTTNPNLKLAQCKCGVRYNVKRSQWKEMIYLNQPVVFVDGDPSLADPLADPQLLV